MVQLLKSNGSISDGNDNVKSLRRGDVILQLHRNHIARILSIDTLIINQSQLGGFYRIMETRTQEKEAFF